MGFLHVKNAIYTNVDLVRYKYGEDIIDDLVYVARLYTAMEDIIRPVCIC